MTVHGGKGVSIGGVVMVWLEAVTVTVNPSVMVCVTISTGVAVNRITPEQFEAVMLSSIEEVGLDERLVMVLLLMVLLFDMVIDGMAGTSVVIEDSSTSSVSVFGLPEGLSVSSTDELNIEVVLAVWLVVKVSLVVEEFV
jgi:hypothetical protein